MMQVVKALAVAFIATSIGAASSSASPITYRLTGDLTATLQSGPVTTDFVGAPFVWTVTSDTGLETTVLTHGGPTPEFPALTDVLKVGAESLVPSIPTVFAVASVPAIPPNPAFGIGGFVDSTALMGLAWHADALFGYAGTGSIGPLPVVLDNAGPLPTAAGTLTISALTDNLRFSAVVDEPPGLALMMIGILGCAAAGSLRRKSR